MKQREERQPNLETLLENKKKADQFAKGRGDSVKKKRDMTTDTEGLRGGGHLCPKKPHPCTKFHRVQVFRREEEKVR